MNPASVHDKLRDQPANRRDESTKLMLNLPFSFHFFLYSHDFIKNINMSLSIWKSIWCSYSKFESTNVGWNINGLLLSYQCICCARFCSRVFHERLESLVFLWSLNNIEAMFDICIKMIFSIGDFPILIFYDELFMIEKVELFVCGLYALFNYMRFFGIGNTNLSQLFKGISYNILTVIFNRWR